MAINLKLDVVDFATIPVEFIIPGFKKPLIFGKKILVDEKQLEEARDKWIELQNPSYLKEAQKNLLAEEGNTLSEEEHKNLLAKYKQALLDQTEEQLRFLKTFVVYIQNAEISGKDDETNEEKKITVPDTRTVQPNESLWGGADECLAVLLDVYMQYRPLRDSFFTEFSTTLFSTHELVKAKIKN